MAVKSFISDPLSHSSVTIAPANEPYYIFIDFDYLFVSFLRAIIKDPDSPVGLLI